MSYEKDLVNRLAREQREVDRPRRLHTLKMGVAGAFLLASVGLFACGRLGPGRDAEQTRAVRQASNDPHRLDRVEAAQRLLSASGPELVALLTASASGVYLIVLVLRLRRL